MNLEELRIAQHKAITWSADVGRFWRQFLSEIGTLGATTQSLEGISLGWSLPDSELEDLNLKPGLSGWSFPPSYPDWLQRHPVKTTVFIAGLAQSITIHTLKFNIAPIQGGAFNLEIMNEHGVYRVLVGQLALPLRMVSQNPRFESFFLWSSPADNAKIRYRLIQWLTRQAAESEFYLPAAPPPRPELTDHIGKAIEIGQMAGCLAVVFGIVCMAIVFLFHSITEWLSTIF